MRDRALFQLGGPTRTELTGTTNYIGIWVNQALRDLTTKNRYMGLRKNFVFPQLETSTDDTTVDGQTYIDVPSDALIVRHLYDTTNNKKLSRIRWYDYVDYTDRETTTAEGKPTEWVRSSNKLYLHPTPDDAYVIDIFYKKLHPELSADADVTLIGDEWDDVLVQLAVIKGQMWMNDWDKVKALKEVWLEDVSGMLGIYDQEELDMRPQIKGSSPYNDFNYKA
jgi:hypothetical protein